MGIWVWWYFLHEERAKLLHLNVSAWSTHNCYYIYSSIHSREIFRIYYLCLYVCIVFVYTYLCTITTASITPVQYI